MRTVRITAKTIEAAVAEGLEKLGISREEAVVHVVEQPSSGLFGLIHKKMAVVDIPHRMKKRRKTLSKKQSPAEEAPAQKSLPKKRRKKRRPKNQRQKKLPKK